MSALWLETEFVGNITQLDDLTVWSGVRVLAVDFKGSTVGTSILQHTRFGTGLSIAGLHTVDREQSLKSYSPQSTCNKMYILLTCIGIGCCHRCGCRNAALALVRHWRIVRRQWRRGQRKQ